MALERERERIPISDFNILLDQYNSRLSGPQEYLMDQEELSNRRFTNALWTVANSTSIDKAGLGLSFAVCVWVPNIYFWVILRWVLKLYAIYYLPVQNLCKVHFLQFLQHVQVPAYLHYSLCFLWGLSVSGCIKTWCHGWPQVPSPSSVSVARVWILQCSEWVAERVNLAISKVENLLMLSFNWAHLRLALFP